ncbi:MAG: nucleotide exchange factor GrpE [Phycisphaerae bacterium]|nr:nucleotide exchange factor GrpE [Phycisphaerae bacterium]
MSGKTRKTTKSRTSSTKQTTSGQAASKRDGKKTKAKTPAATSVSKKVEPATATPETPATRTTGHATSRSATATAEKRATEVGKPEPGASTKPPKKSARPNSPSADILAKAEAEISSAIESLNNQMNAAIATLTELAVTQRGRGEAVVHTVPLDRATATFQRLVSEVVDDQLAEMLPTLVALRSEIAQRGLDSDPPCSGDDDFHDRGVEMLDQVLAGAGVSQYDARPSEAFDPVIHLAVGETHRDDLDDGVVAEPLQPGFRTARGKVIAPARVKVNRR